MIQTLAGRCIHRTDGGVRVMDNALFRWMMFESSAIQTLLYKPAPHKYGLPYIRYLTFMAQILPGSIALLGLGGAGAAHTLSGKPLTIVELNPEVVELARDYFMLDRIQPVEVILADACDFVRNDAQRYDHLLIDLYDAHRYPSNCNNPEFFDECYQRLHDGGILAINLANHHDHRPVFDLIRERFAGATVCLPVKNRENLVVLASKGDKRLLDTFAQHKQVASFRWDQAWGCVAILRKR